MESNRFLFFILPPVVIVLSSLVSVGLGFVVFLLTLTMLLTGIVACLAMSDPAAALQSPLDELEAEQMPTIFVNLWNLCVAHLKPLSHASIVMLAAFMIAAGASVGCGIVGYVIGLLITLFFGIMIFVLRHEKARVDKEAAEEVED